MTLETKIIDLIKKNGPMTGAELMVDITRGNQLRLSPSILRDFLTFSLIYNADQTVDIVESGTRLANRFRAISLEKLHMARRALLDLDEDLQEVINNS